MIRLLLEAGIPIVLIVAAAVFTVYFSLKYPIPQALGRILPKLCVVDSQEILRYNQLLEELQGTHLRYAVRRSQIRVNRAFLAQMTLNTQLFQQVVRFEKIKIDPTKSSLDYEPREAMILELVDESARLRLRLVQAQISLLMHSLTGSSIRQDALERLLGTYKELEQDMVELAGMSGNSFYHQMLMERLGLANWGLIEGESSAPA